jgi:RNA polymerase sigma factor (sigma-70 family)
MSGDRTSRVRDFVPSQRLEALKYAFGRAITYARKKLSLSAADANEVASRAAVRAIAKLEQYQEQPGVSFDAWFRKIVTNLVRDEHRHRERTTRLRDFAKEATRAAPTLPPNLELANFQAKMRRDQLVAQLPSDLRVVFEVWVQQHDQSINRTEAAARLGMTMAGYEAAKKRVERESLKALERLRFDTGDLWSEMPVAVGANAGREEEDQ